MTVARRDRLQQTCLKNNAYKDVYVWHTSVERPVTVACTEASTHAQALAGHQLESDAHDRCVHARYACGPHDF